MSTTVGSTPVQVTATASGKKRVTVSSGDTVFASPSASVSTLIYDHSYVAGSSVELASSLYFVSASSSTLDVESVDLEGPSSSLLDRINVVTEAPINPLYPEYGAVGDGTTDDTAALQAAYAALPSTGGSVLISRPFKATSPIAITKSGTRTLGTGRARAKITNASSDVFTLGDGASSLSYLVFDGLTIESTAGGGHCFAPAKGVGMSTFRDLRVKQYNTAKSLWQQDTVGYHVDNLWLECELEHVTGATVPGFNLRTASGDINANTWFKCRYTYSGEFFFLVEQTASGTYVYDNAWRDANCEVLTGGFVKILSGQGNVLDNVKNYDMAVVGASTRDFIYLGKSASAPATVATTIKSVGRRNGVLGGGLFDVKLQGSSQVGRTRIETPHNATLSGFAMDLGSSGGVELVGPMAGVTISNQGVDTVILDPYNGGVPCRSKAGIPSDADFTVTPPVGTQVVDTSNNRLYTRTASATWKYAALT